VALARTVMGEVRTAERDLTKLVRKPGGKRCASSLECHHLLRLADADHGRFSQKHWPEVELDLGIGLHPNPLALLADNKTIW